MNDFLYSCVSHLSDPGVSESVSLVQCGVLIRAPSPQFARPAPSTAPSTPGTTPPSTPSASAVSQAEIDKVKAEYEERQRKKKEAASDKDKDKNNDKDKSWLSTGMSGLSTLASTTKDLFAAPPTSAPPSPTLNGTPSPATAKVFVLHRDVFRMRVDQKRKVWQAKEAKDRVRQLALPSAPRGGLPPPARA